MLSTPEYVLRQQVPNDADVILHIHETSFGPGRFARTAFRIRETADAAPQLCFVALEPMSEKVIGSVILSTIKVGDTPGLLLGPLAVLPEHKSKGAGKMLLQHSVETARTLGENFILLVGDEPYYAPFGFERVKPGQITLPGPVDPMRLLICPLQDAADLSGGVSGVTDPRDTT